MTIEFGCPIRVTADGIRELEPVSLETRLYWEQQLDHGDARLEPISNLPDYAQGCGECTHRLYSCTGLQANVIVDECGERDWPLVGHPPELQWIIDAAHTLERLRLTVQRQVLALWLMEAEG